MKLTHLAATTAALLIGSTAAQLSTAKPNEAAAELANLLSQTNSMSASFVQQSKTPVVKTTKANTSHTPLMTMAKPKSMTGQVLVEKPSKFRWETKSPAPQLIVTEGSALWVYDPDLMQATQQTLDQQIAQTPALLLSGDPDQIVKSYQVKRSSKVKGGYILTPRSEQSAFESMGLVFASNTLTSMLLKDNLGQVTEIQFSNIKKNPSIDDSVFRFTPPQGVDVIMQ